MSVLSKGFLTSKVNALGILSVVIAVLQYIQSSGLNIVNTTMFFGGILLVIARTLMKSFDVSMWSKRINWVAILTGGASIFQMVADQGINWKNPWGLIIAILTMIASQKTTKPIKGVI